MDKQKVIDDYMAKKSNAKLQDKMQSMGLSDFEIQTLKRLPISHESIVEIVNQLIYKKAMDEEKQSKHKT